MSETDHYLRLQTFINEGCPNPMIKLFEQKARADPRPGVPYTTFDTFLNFHQPDIKDMQKKNIINASQYSMIFPHANTDEWDVSLISSFLKALFKRDLKKAEIEPIDKIRNIRNELYHLAGRCELNDFDFSHKWAILNIATCELARCVDNPDCLKEMEAYIHDLKFKPLQPGGPAVDIQKQLYASDIPAIKEDARSARIATRTVETLLNQSSESTITSTGHVVKRLKTVDPVLVSLKDRFKCTLDSNVPSDIQPTKLIEDIRSRVREHHRVVVSGHNNTETIVTAIAALKGLKYDDSRCIQIKETNEWLHVCGEDVDLVLFVDPFGKDQYDDKAAKAMYDNNFDRMLAATNKDNQNRRIDIVIVTDHTILQDVNEKYTHAILDQRVAIKKETTEHDPLYLVDQETKRRNYDPVFENLLDHSNAYIEHKQMHKTSFNSLVFDNANALFKQHKMVLITGPKHIGKSCLAVELMKERTKTCIVLTHPSDRKYVTIGETSIVLIKHFTGKGDYDASKAVDWLTEFDMLYAAVKRGKLSVIITCEENHFRNFKKDDIKHEILAHRIPLTKKDIRSQVIKREKNKTEEIVLNFTLENLGEIPTNEKMYTSKQMVDNVEWILVIEKKRYNGDTSFLYFAMHLICKTEAHFRSESRKIRARFTIKSQKTERKYIASESEINQIRLDLFVGHPLLVRCVDLINKRNGLIENGKVFIEVRLTYV